MSYSYDVMMRCCQLRSQGMARNAISKEVGINRRTLYSWIKQGERARVGKFKRFYDKWSDAEEKYRKMYPPKNTYNPRYAREKNAGYVKFKEKVLARDDYICVCCGHDDNLVVHHLDGAANNPDKAVDVDNGVTLCKYCHQKYHHIYGTRNTKSDDFNEFMDKFAVIK